MEQVVTFLLTLFATTLGAATGMGGGVIIKPAMDMLGYTDAGSIGMLSTVTVLAMAVVSVLRQKGSTEKPPAATAVPLAIGAALGGIVGNEGIAGLTKNARPQTVVVVQNVILAALIVLSFLYISNKSRISSKGMKGPWTAVGAGLFLGVISSFLSIGGGPINVSLIIFLFSMTTKMAAMCSLVAILFSQGAKLATVLLWGGIAGYDLALLPLMVVGAVGGGFLGTVVRGRICERTADRLFNAVQVLVLFICITNIVRNM